MGKLIELYTDKPPDLDQLEKVYCDECESTGFKCYLDDLENCQVFVFECAVCGSTTWFKPEN